MENIKDYMPESPDFNQERLETLKQMFPDLFTSENKLNVNELKKIIEPESITETERYEFRWFGKSNAKRNAFTPSNATLVYDEERSVNPAESENIIIEGENLEVLKLLSASYREKIKCIYIDPPYNTGKDFVYSDNFTQDKKAYWEDAGIVEDGLKIDTNTETDGRYHSNWLNMMYSRLLVARQLLKEDGVIFISIDDNEAHHLRKLCDDVFGENNFVANIIWEKKFAPQNDAKWFSQNHDFIVCISKNKSQWFPNLLERSAELNERYKNLDNDPRGDWTSGDLLRKDFQKSGSYIITAPSGKKHSPPTGRSWRFSEQKFNELLDQDRVWFGESGENVPRIKRFLTDVQDGMKVTTIWKFSEVGHNQEATQELRTIFEGDAFFDTPKPVKLIDRLLKIATSPEDTILDFFSGSGTTGQAVMELNQEDGGNRNFILVQLPEKTDDKSEAYKAGYKKISDITIERNKRVVEKIIEAKKAEQPDLFTEDNKEENLKGLGFKVFKLAKSNFPRVDFAPDPEKTDAENVELLKKYIADKEAQLVNAFNRGELLTEILLKKGFNLNYTTELQPQFTKNEILLAQDGEKETLISLDVTIADETVEYFKTHTSQKFICLERALDTTKKYNLKHYLGDLVDVF
ncbi:site-specific DNA-methyltransferase [Kaistella yonginensis]|uniref:site-specific DNA-methyltransferase n=1 Tax=Kaistella yonginensis TaxID=658267 RepID=UPI0025B2AFB4|nr:site-specific DNA-methyltransferase [Kaistella yonginensis]MDN3607699.1 site-specific DNA-methyltransferase [Kaistella yonginensis]